MASPGSSSTTRAGTSPRILACQACQRRKLKCERVFPCTQCRKRGLHCHPSTSIPRNRKNRHTVTPDTSLASHNSSGAAGLNATATESSRLGESLSGLSRNLWTGLTDEFHAPENTGQEPRSDELANSGSVMTSLMLGSSSSDKSFPPACPSAALTSILWFTFLDNVDPVTKIVHVPTTSKIVDSVVRDIHAASAKSISMVFSIFLIAVVSMTETECERSLGQKRDELTLKFQEAACQSLQKANFLASHDLQLLQTFVMYTLALRQTCAPSALWILTGIAMRMAQRLGLHRDVYRVEFSVFETQLRRRLWWQVVILDSRATQLSGQSHLPDPLISNSNTRLPLNILDEDMSRDSSEAPVECTGLTDMVFCLIRYEFGQFLRDPEQGPTLFDQKIPLTTKEEIISRFETLLELKYLRFCDPSNPLHLLSSFMARSGLCKLRLQIHHPRHRPEQAEGSVVKRDVLLVISLKMTEQHNVARSTASIQRYLWHMQNYFQADAFVLLLIELRKLPGHQLAHHAWQQVAETLQYQPQIINDTQSALYAEIRLLILRAWTAYEEHVSSHCSVGSSTSFLFRVPDFVETLKSQVASNQSEDMRSAAEVVGDLEQSYDFDVNWQSWDELLSQPCRDDFFFNDSDCLS